MSYGLKKSQPSIIDLRNLPDSYDGLAIIGGLLQDNTWYDQIQFCDQSLFNCVDLDHATLILGALRAGNQEGKNQLFDTLWKILLKNSKNKKDPNETIP